MRKVALALMLLLLALMFAGAAHAAERPIRLFLAGGQEIHPPAPPFIARARVMVPLRAVSEAVGFGVEWAPGTEWPVKVYPTLPGIFGPGSVAQDIGFVGMKPGEANFVFIPRKTAAPGSNVFTGQHDYARAKKFTSDVPPTLRGGTVFVPLRVVAEALGCTVNWDGKARTVTVGPSDPMTVAGLSPHVYLGQDIAVKEVAVEKASRWKGDDLVTGYFAGPTRVKVVLVLASSGSPDIYRLENVPFRLFLDGSPGGSGVQPCVFSYAQSVLEGSEIAGSAATVPVTLTPGRHTFRVEVDATRFFDANGANNVKEITVDVEDDPEK